MSSITSPTHRFVATDWRFSRRLDFWAEVMWLAALVLVPLMFSFNGSTLNYEDPKIYALHFLSLILAVMLVWTGINALQSKWNDRSRYASVDIVAIVRRRPDTLLLIVVGLFTFSYIVSTMLSPVVWFSVFGVSSESTGYNLYTYLSAFIIFVSIIVYTRNAAQAWRILYVFAIVGTVTAIYGILQSGDLDILSDFSSQQRVISSFGNPIYFGAYLVVTIPLTVAIIARDWIHNVWIRAVLLSAALSAQVLALWLTGSRGPILGLAAGTIFAVVLITPLYIRTVTRQQLLIGIILLIGPIATLLLIVPNENIYARGIQLNGQLSFVTNELQSTLDPSDTPPLDGDAGFVNAPEDGPDSIFSPSAFEGPLSDVLPVAHNSTSSGVVEAGLAGRIDVWKDVAELSVSWETPANENVVTRSLRPVFGYGPDMLRYSTPLVSNPRTSMEVFDHAHNRLLHTLGELGWSGAVLFGLTFLAVAAISVTAYRHALKQKSKIDNAIIFAFVLVVSSFVAASVEQQVGVGRIADILNGWIILALLVVLYGMIVKPLASSEIDSTGSAVAQTASIAKAKRRTGERTTGSDITLVPVVVTSIFALLAALLFLSVDITNLRASMLGAKATKDPVVSTSVVTLREARELAPNYEELTLISADRLLTEARRFKDNGDVESATLVANAAHQQLLEYEERNPLALRTRVMLANASSLRVELGIENSLGEAIARFDDLARQFPNEGELLSSVAAIHLLAGQSDTARELSERAIQIETQTGPIPQAWWVRGVALEALGETRQAAISHLSVLLRDSSSLIAVSSHRSLASLYEESGDTEQAEKHRTAADDLETVLSTG